MIEAVIFDMDGVLADTEYYYENRRKNFLLENGIPIPEGNFIGSNEKAIWEAIVPNDPVRRQEMLMAYREYRKVRPTPYGKLTDPQAEPLMNALRSRGLKVAVASSSAAPDIMKMLTEGGLKAMVDFAFSGEDCAAHKPAPDIYLKALKALGLTADKAIAVEDSPTGIASAKAAGLKVLALKPRHGEPLDQSAADCIITRLMDAAIVNSGEIIEKGFQPVRKCRMPTHLWKNHSGWALFAVNENVSFTACFVQPPGCSLPAFWRPEA